MTPTENIQLERIEEKIDTLNNFMATYTEKSKHCAEKFREMEDTKKEIDKRIGEVAKEARWSKLKIVFFSGGLTVAWAVLTLFFAYLLKLKFG